MAEYKINKTGAQIEASLTKADTAVQKPASASSDTLVYATKM